MLSDQFGSSQFDAILRYKMGAAEMQTDVQHGQARSTSCATCVAVHFTVNVTHCIKEFGKLQVCGLFHFFIYL